MSLARIIGDSGTRGRNVSSNVGTEGDFDQTVSTENVATDQRPVRASATGSASGRSGNGTVWAPSADSRDGGDASGATGSKPNCYSAISTFKAFDLPPLGHRNDPLTTDTSFA